MANEYKGFDLSSSWDSFQLDMTPKTTDFSTWKTEFEKSMPDFSLNLRPSYDPTIPLAASLPSMNSGNSGASGYADPLKSLDTIGNSLMGIKDSANRSLKAGYNLKIAAAAGEFFSKVLTYSMARSNANRAYRNKQQSVENQMLAIDNQVQYYKNQIADKFGQTMARNAMTMAAKGLRVTAGNLLEQTKDMAYDATKDIETLESNARLKKIALRSEEKQAKVARNLTKQLLASDLVSSAANLGLKIYGGKLALKALEQDALGQLNTPYGSAIDPAHVMSANNLYRS